MDNEVESNLSRILLLEIKKVTAIRCKYFFIFCPTTTLLTTMVRSFINIQYQSTGVSSLPSLGEIGLRQTIQSGFKAVFLTVSGSVHKIHKHNFDFQYNYI